MSDLLKLAGLWKGGKAYTAFVRQDGYNDAALSLIRESIANEDTFKVVLLKNERKEGNQPDLALFVAPADDAPGGTGSYPDDDVPF